MAELPVFVISVIATFVPIVIYVIQKKRGKIRTNITYGADEITFEEKYPVKH
jgi:hypothetical protein